MGSRTPSWTRAIARIAFAPLARTGDVELKFITREHEAIVLEAFRARREE
jgi:hypothetical protein